MTSNVIIFQNWIYLNSIYIMPNTKIHLLVTISCWWRVNRRLTLSKTVTHAADDGKAALMHTTHTQRPTKLQVIWWARDQLEEVMRAFAWNLRALRFRWRGWETDSEGLDWRGTRSRSYLHNKSITNGNPSQRTGAISTDRQSQQTFWLEFSSQASNLSCSKSSNQNEYAMHIRLSYRMKEMFDSVPTWLSAFGFCARSPH